MVRAILEGRKTQTRRVAPISSFDIRQHDKEIVTWSVAFSKPIKGVLSSYSGGKFSTDQACRIVASQFCPYGQPGDRLWVRETWMFCQGGPIYDAAGGLMDSMDDEIFYRASRPRYPGPWRSSIHMPRWASRITLEVTGVRVERLNDITPAECVCEGYYSPPGTRYAQEELKALDWYRDLWESINGPGSWESNPWVWVIEFKRINQPSKENV
jgi:hypothetical protein